MKKNELTNRENTSFENGFGMNDEEMNQIVGGSTFMNESAFSAQLSSQTVSGPFSDLVCAENATWCIVCESTLVVIYRCDSQKNE